MPLTVIQDSARGRVQIIVVYSEAGTQTTVDLYRGFSATGPWTFLRTLPLLGERAVTYDNSYPMDTDTWWRVVPDVGTELIEGPRNLSSAAGIIWMKDPGRPWADIAMRICSATDPTPHNEACAPEDSSVVFVGFGDIVRSADASLFPVLNSQTPVDVYGKRKFFNSSLGFLTRGLTGKDLVHQLYAAGGPLFISAPFTYGWGDHHVQPADLVEQRLWNDQRRSPRVWEVPVTKVEEPLGPVQGTECTNWCAIADTYPTFADLTATGLTWAQIATNGVC